MTIKKKKIFFLPLFLLIVLFSFSFLPAMAADCIKNCGDCLDAQGCGISPARCQWDTAKKQCCWATQANWPKSPLGTQLTGCGEISAAIKYFYEWGIALGGFAAFVSLIVAGFQYLISAGNPTMMKDSMDRIQSSILGLVLLLASWLILDTINPELTTWRPIGSLSINACNTTVDCPDCSSPSDPNCLYFCNDQRDDKNKDGLCILKTPALTGIQACDYVEIYEQMNFGVSGKKVWLTPKNDCTDINFLPRSSRGFVNGVISENCVATLTFAGEPGCQGSTLIGFLFSAYNKNIDYSASLSIIRSVKGQFFSK